MYLSNRANSCTSEKHGSHSGLLNAHLNSVLLSKASCFTFKNSFQNILFCIHFAQEKKLKKKINGYETNTSFTSNLNGYKEWRRNKQKDPCTLPSPLSTFCSHTVIQAPCPSYGFSRIKLRSALGFFFPLLSLSRGFPLAIAWIDPSLPSSLSITSLSGRISLPAGITQPPTPYHSPV